MCVRLIGRWSVYEFWFYGGFFFFGWIWIVDEVSLWLKMGVVMIDICCLGSVVLLVLVVLGLEIWVRSKFVKVRWFRSKGLGMIYIYWLIIISFFIEFFYLGWYEYVRMEVWLGVEVWSVKKEGKMGGVDSVDFIMKLIYCEGLFWCFWCMFFNM